MGDGELLVDADVAVTSINFASSSAIRNRCRAVDDLLILNNLGAERSCTGAQCVDQTADYVFCS